VVSHGGESFMRRVDDHRIPASSRGFRARKEIVGTAGVFDLARSDPDQEQAVKVLDCIGGLAELTDFDPACKLPPSALPEKVTGVHRRLKALLVSEAQALARQRQLLLLGSEEDGEGPLALAHRDLEDLPRCELAGCGAVGRESDHAGGG